MRIKVNPGVAWQALALCGRQSATATQRLRQAATATAAAMAKLRYVLWIVLQHFRRSLPSYTDSCRQWSDAPAIAHSTYPHPPQLYLWLYPFPNPLSPSPSPMLTHKGKSRSGVAPLVCVTHLWHNLLKTAPHTAAHIYIHQHTHNSIRTRGCLVGGGGEGADKFLIPVNDLSPFCALACLGISVAATSKRGMVEGRGGTQHD